MPAVVRAAAFVLSGMISLLAQEPIQRQSRNFTIEMHPGQLPVPLATRLADDALAAAERALPVVTKLYKAPAHMLVIHLYGDEAEYRKAAKKLCPLQFPVDSYYMFEHVQGHVLVSPVVETALLEQFGLPKATVEAVVELAAFLTALDVSKVVEADPWLGELFAAAVVETVCYAEGKPGQPDYDGRRAAPVARARVESRIEPFRARVAYGYPPTRAAYDEDKQWQVALAQLLMTSQPGWAKRLLGAPLKGDRIVAQFADAVDGALGGDAKRQPERFAKLLKALPLKWRIEQPIVEDDGGRVRLLAGEVAAMLWAIAEPPPGPFTVSGRCELRKSDKVQAFVNLDSMLGTFWAFGFSEGRVTASVWNRQDAAWSSVQGFDAPIRLGVPFAFALAVGESVRISIDGAEVGALPVAGRTMHAPWGVSAIQGMVWFDALKVESSAPAPVKKK